MHLHDLIERRSIHLQAERYLKEDGIAPEMVAYLKMLEVAAPMMVALLQMFVVAAPIMVACLKKS